MNWWEFEGGSELNSAQLFGPTVRFKGGGGGGSGKVEYPAYIEAVHNDWLDATGTDTIELSVTEAMDAALGASPWSSATAYDPTTPLADAWTAVCALNTLVDALDHETDWASAVAAIISEYDDTIGDEDTLTDDINAHAQVLAQDLEYRTLPKFRAGYRDVNAVMSSAFVIGESVIYGMNQRDVAKHASSLRLKNYEMRGDFIVRSAELMLRQQMMRVEFEKAVAMLSVEAKRVHIVAEKEEVDQQLTFDENDARWDLECYQYGANVLAAAGGGTMGTGKSKPSTAQSALGGALSGAAMGSAIAPGWGTAIGAVVGAGAALLTS